MQKEIFLSSDTSLVPADHLLFPVPDEHYRANIQLFYGSVMNQILWMATYDIEDFCFLLHEIVDPSDTSEDHLLFSIPVEHSLAKI